ncbi:hypothetical protein BCR37DRAFT_25 [Protomyces lactucae-debilis]|uniref:1-phosphatidylinositol 4-kinase n=1 Tax=Protomyces lactucae-debilis TaxID=2754530 RepID=A0A1Y2FW55_PROLT|nr:uncharacterized protein BCR37DRAFT_25 [Protomyces lactucae-debilis]ORY87534.1 hypothetical protein BCR37DRAFT_25 [Protomyces lactucae-debilis]
MACRQQALVRLAALAADGRHGNVQKERIADYYHKARGPQSAAESSRRLTRRELAAFQGYAASCVQSTSPGIAVSLIRDYEDIVGRWPRMQEASDKGMHSSLELQQFAHTTAISLLRLSETHPDESQAVKDLLLKMTRKAQADELVSLATLAGFLSAVKEFPLVILYSDFVVLVETFNTILPKLHKISSRGSAASLTDLPDTSRIGAYPFEIQHAVITFVLAWTKSAVLNGLDCQDLWTTLGDPGVPLGKDRLPDPLVWQTVVAHVKIQYDLTNSTVLSRFSEAVLGRALKVYCLAAVSLGQFDEILLSWLHNLVMDAQELDDPVLGPAVVNVMSILAVRFPEHATVFINHLKSVVQYAPRVTTGEHLSVLSAKRLLAVLQYYSNDAIISTMYHFANLFAPAGVDSVRLQAGSYNESISSRATRSLPTDDTARNAVEAVSTFATACEDEQIGALGISILLQKFTRVSSLLQRKIVVELAVMARQSGEKDVLRVVALYSAVEKAAPDELITNAIKEARFSIGGQLDAEHPAYLPYLGTLLRATIIRTAEKKRPPLDALIEPLAVLLDKDSRPAYSPDLVQLFHNFWFHLVIYGYTLGSTRVTQQQSNLRRIAHASPSLALETLTDALEADLDSYPVLRQEHDHADTKVLQAALDAFLSVQGSLVRRLSFSKAVYLNAIALLENLRSSSGVAAGSLAYYEEATLRNSDVSTLVDAIHYENTRRFLAAIHKLGEPMRLDVQLRDLIVGACHRVKAVRDQAILTINQIVEHVPSAFCNQLVITTLLESITLLGWSCYEEFTDKYSPSYNFTSQRVDLTITVSDSFSDRKISLDMAERHAAQWLDAAMRDCAEDIRSLLSTYIMHQEEHDFSSDRGRLLAIQYAVRSSARDQPSPTEQVRDSSDAFVGELSLRHLQSLVPARTSEPEQKLPSSRQLLEKSRRRSFISSTELKEKLGFCVARILDGAADTNRLLMLLVEVPFNIFSIPVVRIAASLWARVATACPHLQPTLLAEIDCCWGRTLAEGRGIFSAKFNSRDPFAHVMEYAPTDKDSIRMAVKATEQAFEPHLIIIQFLASRVSGPGSTDTEGQKILVRLIRTTLRALMTNRASMHIFCFEPILRLVIIGFKLKSNLRALGLGVLSEAFEKCLYDSSLFIFAAPPRWSFGSDVGRLRKDSLLCNILNEQIRRDKPAEALIGKRELIQLLLKSDIAKNELWLDPLSKTKPHAVETSQVLALLPVAWDHSCALALSMAQRFSSPAIRSAVRALIIKQPRRVVGHAHAAEYLLGTELSDDTRVVLKYLVYWSPAVPISAITYFLPAFKMHPLVLQYAVRSLESHPVEVTFFYVPQIVQLLRHDEKGYVRRFIIETAKLSQLFAHQIIWNFNANAYKDEDATIEDVIKPALDQTAAIMIRNLSGSDKAFYETEFRFFGEVTSISGKLKPYIKKPKPEKKAKIDEEMAKIKVEEGVYLPSNPDGVVVGIDRKSGRPLQSHAKAPFMATFKIRRERKQEDLLGETKLVTFEKMQSAIFKVGDDCRQDVLAIQLIATFRGIFNSIGLDLYVFPYRVTATAPGCGVIDVLPNSISRDMLGREAVNGLYDYFITSFGQPDTIAFQQARMNFVKSMAAYSVISYLLQFKDRHNGNIMYDNQGHVLHIDFGFCFDIAPGGITFESAPFKFTTEMVAVMGGSEHTQSYKMFQELCIKAFLVSRQYSEKIIHLVTLMLESGLPCFKGQQTITNLRNRFHLDVSEPQASQVMLSLIAKSHENQRTVAYDVFQKMTNGIPH